MCKILREYQTKHSMFPNLFPKIAAFPRSCAKMRYSRTGHRWKCHKENSFACWINKAKDTIAIYRS